MIYRWAELQRANQTLLMRLHYPKPDSGLAVGSVDNVESVRAPTGSGEAQKLIRRMRVR